MRLTLAAISLALGCASAQPGVHLGQELSLGALSLRIAPPVGWSAAEQPGGSVVIGAPERTRYASWIRLGPRSEAAVDAAGWVEPLVEQQVLADPESEQEITRVTGTFASGRARYPVRADVAYRKLLPEVRASLETLRAGDRDGR